MHHHLDPGPCRGASNDQSRGEETLFGSWAELAATSPGAYLASTRSSVAAVFPNWLPLNNGFVLDAPTPAAASAAAAELSQVYAAAGVTSWAMWLRSTSASLDAPDLIDVVDGMVRDVTTVAMTRPLHAALPSHPRVKRTTAAAASVAGDTPIPLASLPRADESSEVDGWVLVTDTHAVAGAWTYRDGSDVGVYAVGTVEEFRRRGYARALMLHVLAAAYTSGARTASLQATPMGLPLYESLGFRAVGRYEEWVPRSDSMRVLLISGSTRPGSSNTRALRALHEADDRKTVTDLYVALQALPGFVPGSAPPAPVRDLLARIEAADAVVFSTPEYAGGLPGTLKNLLDWTVGGGQLYAKPVAWLDVANPGRGDGARAQLRTVLGYVGAHIVESACGQQLLEALAGAVAAKRS